MIALLLVLSHVAPTQPLSLVLFTLRSHSRISPKVFWRLESRAERLRRLRRQSRGIDRHVVQLSGRAADLLDNAEVKRAYLGG
jgi:hypothetical protein